MTLRKNTQLSFHKFSFDKNFIKYYCKKIEENYSRLLKIERKKRNTTVSDFIESTFFINSGKTFSATKEFGNTSLESIQNQNKQLLTNLDDLSRIISSLEETILLKNQCVTKRTFFGYKRKKKSRFLLKL